MITLRIVLYICIFFVAFFPAYLGYQEQHAWVGYVFTIAFALSSYIPYLRDQGKRWWIALVLLAVFGYSIESLWVLTCFPYGCFWYSEQLWFRIAGIVPLMLAFTRPPLVLWVWSFIKNIAWPSWKKRIRWGLWLVLVDLILDPIAVMMGLWSYPSWGFRFGVPLSNFAGWLLSGTIGIMIIDSIVWSNKNTKRYDYGLRCTIIFFVGYAVWKVLLSH